MDPVEAIAATICYEGYVLWPYRRSAMKNRKRWLLGVVYPRAYSEAGGGSDPWRMQTQCLILGHAPIVSIKVRFLHVVDRLVGRATDEGLAWVDALRVGEARYLAWEEATEREVFIDALAVAELRAPACVPIAIAAGSTEEPLLEADGRFAGALVRRWEALEGAVEVRAEPLQDRAFKLTVQITNTTSWSGQQRVLLQTFVSAHTILRVTAGEFVSLLDPPASLKPLVDSCVNLNTWPVLAGPEEERRTLLSAPIILYDYPRVAPESHGDLFDSTEIDQLLTLNILTLTDAEKEEMRASDPRTRAILERTESLTAADFMKLHGAFREFRMLREEGEINPLFAAVERRPPESVVVRGATLRVGSKVRLRPRPCGDIFDLALAGRVASVVAIEQDYDERIHLAVTLDDDPGRDLGAQGQVGHRFYFAPEEVEPLDDSEGD
jgi:hypothetical protein